MPKNIPLYEAFLVERLLEVCPDLQQLVDEWPQEECLVTSIQNEYVEEDFRLHPSYDFGRVHFFMREFERGKDVPYIVMDSSSRGDWTPLIMDGRHRAVAAVHAGVPYIDVSFSGLVSVANYCTGKRKTNPLC